MRLARLLKPGQTVYLFGELGSGKTVFVKGMAPALGVPEEDVTSASFTIIAEHEGTNGRPFYHVDLYRLEDAGDIHETGIDEYPGPDGIAVIEWAERLFLPFSPRPAGGVMVRINVTRGGPVSRQGPREIIIEGVDEEDWHHS